MARRRWQFHYPEVVSRVIATIAVLALGLAMVLPAKAAFFTPHDFAGAAADGSNPFGTLVRDPATGNYYGTTSTGGKFGLGTVYCMDPNYGVTILHNFSGTDGNYPTCTLILVPGTAANGAPAMLYGTTLRGGKANMGVIFRLPVTGVGYLKLHDFTGAPDGANPYAGVILGSNGILYGTTLNGGQFGLGTTYKIGLAGGVYKVTHSFWGNLPGVVPDGAHPFGRLLEYQTGMLAGTTAFAGGPADDGTVFTETFLGASYATIHRFTGTPDGAHPISEVIETISPTGLPLLWGTTRDGGAGSQGTVYSVGIGGAPYNVEYSFLGGPDGANPFGGLIVSSVTGDIYGTTANGGAAGNGTVYELMPGGPPPLPELVFHSFAFGEGEHPYAALIESPGGAALFSTTRDGGALFDGTIFWQTP